MLSAHVSKNRIMFGYQDKQAEFKDGDLTTNFSYTGPMAAFNFRFRFLLEKLT
jgi:hypothetical protein